MALPVILVFTGGALGGATGAIAVGMNVHVFRSNLNGIGKFVLTGIISLLAVAVYLIAATLILNVLGRK